MRHNLLLIVDAAGIFVYDVSSQGLTVAIFNFIQ